MHNTIPYEWTIFLTGFFLGIAGTIFSFYIMMKKAKVLDKFKEIWC
jgi:uncharacterized membrane protein YjjP (DUF1212 family)